MQIREWGFRDYSLCPPKHHGQDPLSPNKPEWESLRNQVAEPEIPRAVGRPGGWAGCRPCFPQECAHPWGGAVRPESRRRALWKAAAGDWLVF